MRPVSRQHHYLPVWYLVGFTPSGCKSDRLWVHDLRPPSRRDPEQPGIWASLPGKVARQRDLYTVSSGPTEPDLFERELANYDDEHAALVREVCQSRQCPTERFGDLLKFVALTYARSPSMRPQMTRWVEQHTGLPFEEAIQRPENWRWLAESRRQPLSAIRDRVAKYGGGKAKGQLFHVRLIDALLHLMLPLLKSRQWSLCLTQGEDSFVCSNMPLAITWPVEHPSDKPPTFGDDAAILTFPLERHTALVAGLDEHYCVRHVGRAAVAETNSQTVLSLRTHRVQHAFVFAPAREFYCMGNDGLLQVSGGDFKLVSEPTGEG